MNREIFLGVIILILICVILATSDNSKNHIKRIRIPILNYDSDSNTDKNSLNDLKNSAQHRKFRGVSDNVNSIQSKWSSDIDIPYQAANGNLDYANAEHEVSTLSYPSSIRVGNEIIKNDIGWQSLDEQHNRSSSSFSEYYDNFLLKK